MAYQALFNMNKPYFTTEDVAQALGTSAASAAVLCSRYIKQGLLVRLKKGVYARKEVAPRGSSEQKIAFSPYFPEQVLMRGFTKKDFDVKLGSVLLPDLREYYREHRFEYLEQRLAFEDWKKA
jgi:hypothetical protein